MKAKSFKRKLVLKRETVAHLKVDDMKVLYGGTYISRCGTCYCPQTIHLTNCIFC